MKILRFSATWCGPCKKMTPVLAAMQAAHPDLVVESIDIDEDQMEAAAWNVSGVPTLIRLDDEGNEVARLVGAHPKGKVEKTLGIV